MVRLPPPNSPCQNRFTHPCVPWRCSQLTIVNKSSSIIASRIFLSVNDFVTTEQQDDTFRSIGNDRANGVWSGDAGDALTWSLGIFAMPASSDCRSRQLFAIGINENLKNFFSSAEQQNPADKRWFNKWRRPFCTRLKTDLRRSVWGSIIFWINLQVGKKLWWTGSRRLVAMLFIFNWWFVSSMGNK